MKKVTFICSTFNDEQFFDGWVADLINQTIFDDCEIIMVDCNSNQNEWEMALPYKKKYPDNFKLIKLPVDKGLYNGWNYAIKYASGKYISNASMDDRRCSTYAEKLSNFLDLNSNCDVVYTNNYVTNEINETFENNSSDGLEYYSTVKPLFAMEHMLQTNLPHVMPMWRKEIHQKTGMFLESYPSAADWEFWLRATMLGVSMEYYPETLGLYCFNPDGLSSNPTNDSWKLPDERYIQKSYVEYYREHVLNKENTNVSFFNWWKSRNWRTHKKDF